MTVSVISYSPTPASRLGTKDAVPKNSSPPDPPRADVLVAITGTIWAKNSVTRAREAAHPQRRRPGQQAHDQGGNDTNQAEEGQVRQSRIVSNDVRTRVGARGEHGPWTRVRSPEYPVTTFIPIANMAILSTSSTG